MTWTGWAAAALAVFEAGYMVVDGLRALLVGDYFTPSSGEHAGRLGPWASLVARLGIDPRSRGMKLGFVIYGAVWLGVVAAFVAGSGWARAGMLVLAVGSLWYAVIGTVVSAAIVLLLLA